jgi:hypothetical protein
MRRRWALVACAALGLTLVACSSSTSGVPSAVTTTGCHGTRATAHLVLSSQSPIPVVRAVPGTCIEVSVPRSRFPGKDTEPPRVIPPGRLDLVSDTVFGNGSRTVYYSAVHAGTATISSTVDIQTNLEVPEWSGLVVVG